MWQFIYINFMEYIYTLNLGALLIIVLYSVIETFSVCGLKVCYGG